MVHKSIRIIVFFVIGVFLDACSSPQMVTDTVVEATETPLPVMTRIVIDGEEDDWVDRPLLHEDPAGDVEEGFLDITKVYAFVNQDALYVLIQMVDQNAPFIQIDFEVNTDKGVHYFGWRPGSGPPYPYSSFALGSVFEGRIDLRDLDLPEKIVRLTEIRVMVGQEHPSPDWHAADIWNSGAAQVVMVNEVDAIRVGTVLTEEPQEPQTTPVLEPDEFIYSEPLTERPRYVWLEQRKEYADYLFRQFHQNAQEAAWGPDGYLYIADGSGKHIVRVAPDGTLDDLGIWKTHVYMQEFGPNAIEFDKDGNLFFNTGPHLFRRNRDGSIDKIFTAEQGNIRSLTMDDAGILYYSLNTGSIFQWNPDGDDIFLTNEFHDPQILIGPDGQLYIGDSGMNRIVVFDVQTQESRIFAEGYFTDEGAAYMRFDSDGDLWVRITPYLYQFSPKGEIKPFIVDGKPGDEFRWHLAGDIVFDEAGNLWVTYASGEIVRLALVDPNTPIPFFKTDFYYPSFEASDMSVGTDGSVYATNLVPGEIWHFRTDGSYDIIWQHGDQGRVGVAVGDDGVIYAGSIFGEILKMENGEIGHYADLKTERLIIAGDGNLYAAAGQEGEPYAIVRITGKDTYEIIATEIDGIPLGDTTVQIAPAKDHGLYVLSQSSATIFYLNFDGEGYAVVKLADSIKYPRLASSPITGKIYFLAHFIPDPNAKIQRYTLYEYEPGGEFTVISPVVPGDPWDMEVSPDGKWLYIIEVGAIDKIPLGEP